MDMKQANLETRARREAPVQPFLPPVDIVEDAEGITLTADLPGVSKEALSIDVDGDTLTIEGAVGVIEGEQPKTVYAEIRAPHYKRSFVLSRDLDTGNVAAQLAHGVLTLRVPKREVAKPRRIEVKAA